MPAAHAGRMPDPGCPRRLGRLRAVRLVIARCSVDYEGRLQAHLPLATRLLLVKADGSVLIHRAIADRITVLRDGHHILTDDTKNLDRDKIIRAMVVHL